PDVLLHTWEELHLIRGPAPGPVYKISVWRIVDLLGFFFREEWRNVVLGVGQDNYEVEPGHIFIGADQIQDNLHSSRVECDVPTLTVRLDSGVADPEKPGLSWSRTVD